MRCIWMQPVDRQTVVERWQIEISMDRTEKGEVGTTQRHGE